MISGIVVRKDELVRVVKELSGTSIAARPFEIARKLRLQHSSKGFRVAVKFTQKLGKLKCSFLSIFRARRGLFRNDADPIRRITC
jgi:hypothetical protein